MDNQQELYKGKAKSMYPTSDNHELLMRFRDDISAFDGVKVTQLPGKGAVNNCINAFVMKHLATQGIDTHFIKVINETDSLVKKLTMLPIECVVRNVCAGSMAKRYGLEEGKVLRGPIFEFFLKSDALHDPMCNEDHIKILGWTGSWYTSQMKKISLRINEILKPLFDNAGIILVDFKLEFGYDSSGELLLGDEFTPDGCRLWDKKTKEKYDKDRFRRDLGQVIEYYNLVATALGAQKYNSGELS